MVMVNGELYFDTGHESTAEARCGVMDGEIKSEVDGSEKPTENNQSNFGTGYGYQYGSQEGIIEIYMNDKWWVFTTEKVLASSELMIDPVAPVGIQNVFTGENANITENEDIRTLSILLRSNSWNIEGTTDCASNIEITINGETYKYHSDCDTFNDNANQEYLSLNDVVVFPVPGAPVITTILPFSIYTHPRNFLFFLSFNHAILPLIRRNLQVIMHAGK